MSRSSLRVQRWRDEAVRIRLALLAILAAFAVLTAWNLGRAGEFSFYGAAARSMATTWRAFAFGAFDPAATVTLDKLSGFLVPQAAAVRVFGYSASALSLPQVIEGLVTVWCCATIALRLAGAGAGLFAAAAAASTPILVSMFGRPMEDGLLTMALAAAVLWWQRALLTGAAWPLAVSAVLVGVGFQAKMLQAWFVLPALVVGLVVAFGWRPGLARAAGTVALAVGASVAWMVVAQLVPSGARPWFDGSLDDDVFTMVFGFNGVDRLIPGAVSGAVGAAHAAALHLSAAALLQGAVSAQSSPVKLLLPYYLTQIGWCYPLAIAGVVLGAIRWWPWRSGSRQGPDRSGSAVFAALVVWLVVGTLVLSAARLPHTAYVAAIGVQLALLAAVGVAEARRLASGPGAARLVLPALVVVEGAWSLALAVGFTSPAARLPAPLVALLVVLVLAGLAAALVLVARPGLRGRSLAAAVAVGVALCAGAATWSLQSLDPARAGTGVDAYVGVKPRPSGAGALRTVAWRPREPNLWEDGPRLHGAIEQIVRRTERGVTDPATPIFATDAEHVSAPVIEATGHEVLTDGGYSGTVPVLSEARLRALIDSGTLRWVVTQLHPLHPASDAVDVLVRSGACTRVHTWAPDHSERPHGLVLWRCAPGG